MDFVSEIFERANLQHIRAFLPTGEDCLEIGNEAAYAQRLKSAEENILNKVEEILPDKSEREDFTNNIYAYTL